MMKTTESMKVKTMYRNEDENLEKQMGGCMAGFLQIFDRQQILNGKRLYTTKRLPSPVPEMEMYSPSPSVDSSVESPMFSSELKTPQRQQQQTQARSMQPQLKSQNQNQNQNQKQVLPLPVFECKEGIRSSWKFREAPRLSLDSRANVDGKGSIYPKENKAIGKILETKQRSPSVIGKLMGLEALPNEPGREPIKKAELRRSASESRVSKDLRNIDGNNFQVKQTYQNVSVPQTPVKVSTQHVPHFQYQTYQQQQHRKSYFDVYPESAPPQKQHQHQHSDYFYGEIGKRLKMRGIDEPVKDLEALKQILEVLQMKGLLRSSHSTQTSMYNEEESPIVVMKPSRSLSPNIRSKQATTMTPLARARRERESRERSDVVERTNVNDRRMRNLTLCSDIDRSSNERSPSSIMRRKPLNIDTQQGRSHSPAHSPKLSPRKNVVEQVTSKSPRNRKISVAYSVATESETSSQNGSERSKIEGKSLLERCDRLLHSIAEFTTADLQPSPVSVLDYKDESSPSPSPVVTKRCIDFSDGAIDVEDDNRRCPATSPVRLNFEEMPDHPDFLYVSRILKATAVSEDMDVFLLLEKQYYRTNSSRISQLHRRVIHDTITEIRSRKKQSLPWKSINFLLDKSKSSLETIWSEFRRFGDNGHTDTPVEDLSTDGCGDNSAAVKLNTVLDIERLIQKDMAVVDATDGWGDSSAEILHAVLDIERLIFKDLLGESLWDLIGFAKKNRLLAPRRKLLF